jgi:hypothetical protein
MSDEIRSNLMRNLIFLAPALLLAGAATAQSNSSSAGTSSPTNRDVTAGTTSSGTSGDGAIGVSGTADAAAANGGTASTDANARFNTANNTARQRSTATARDDDERARSRSMTNVKPNGDVRSNSMTIYKQRGEKPVITRDRTVNGEPK